MEGGEGGVNGKWGVVMLGVVVMGRGMNEMVGVVVEVGVDGVWRLDGIAEGGRGEWVVGMEGRGKEV